MIHHHWSFNICHVVRGEVPRDDVVAPPGDALLHVITQSTSTHTAASVHHSIPPTSNIVPASSLLLDK